MKIEHSPKNFNYHPAIVAYYSLPDEVAADEALWKKEAGGEEGMNLVDLKN
jgi:hypothetical protein